MRKSKKYIEWQLSRPLLRGAQEREKRKERELKEMFDKEVLKRYENGEYAPINPDDLALVQWCTKYNKKLRDAKAFVKMATDPNRLSPIQKGPLGYRSVDKKDKLLNDWCIEKNAEIRNKVYNGGVNSGK